MYNIVVRDTKRVIMGVREPSEFPVWIEVNEPDVILLPAAPNVDDAWCMCTGNAGVIVTAVKVGEVDSD